MNTHGGGYFCWGLGNKGLGAGFWPVSVPGTAVHWLKALSREDKRIIGKDIATVEFGWPIGMPTCRPLVSRRGLWEVRSSLTGHRIAGVLFSVDRGYMILLHGFIKKTQQTPEGELELAMKRKKEFDRETKAK